MGVNRKTGGEVFKGKMESCNTDLDVFPVSGGRNVGWSAPGKGTRFHPKGEITCCKGCNPHSRAHD